MISEKELFEWVPAVLGSVDQSCYRVCSKQTSEPRCLRHRILSMLRTRWKVLFLHLLLPRAQFVLNEPPKSVPLDCGSKTNRFSKLTETPFPKFTNKKIVLLHQKRTWNIADILF